MSEIILEFLAGIFQESLPNIIKFIGGLVRWSFFRGKKKLSTILAEEWNKRVGFFTVVLIIGIIIWSNS